MIKGSLKDRMTFTFPDEWEIRTLSDITTDIIDNRGKTPPLDKDGKYPLLEIFNMQEDSLNLITQEKQKYVNEEVYQTWFRNGHPSHGDILISTVGNVGIVSYYDKENASIAQNIVALRLNRDKAHSKFLAYYLSSVQFEKWIKGVTMHAVQPSLKVPHLLEGPVPLPLLREQQKIASILSSVDEIISKTEDIIEQTNQIKSGVMRKLFKEGIRNSDFKETKLGKIPYDWEIVRQGDIAKFYNGRAFKEKEFIDEGTPVVRIQNLKGGKNFVYSNLELEKNKYIDKGDLIYAWSATFGPYIWEGNKAIYHYHIWKIEPSENILKKYFYYKLHSLSDDNTSHKKGAVFAHLTKSFMESYEIALPPLKEQQEIVDTLESIDNKISSDLFTLNKLKLIKEGLMQQLLTGKVRVPLNENEEVPQ